MNSILPGGGFLFADEVEVFIREDLSDDQKEFAKTSEQFFLLEVGSRIDEIEAKAVVEESGKAVPIAVNLLHKAGELGLLMVDIGQEYGGLGLDKTTSFRINEGFIGNGSISGTIGAHIGIGTLPIALFGNETQKQTYLPRLVTAEIISCYALTEPGSGSDALSGKTTALRSEDGQDYLLSGSKQFITNAAFADIAIVFANIDGRYSCLIVDLHSEGVLRGVEEKKLGLHGSSTISLSFDKVKVPVENLLGAIGDGPTIALNILNLGRFKLGFSTLGNAKYTLDMVLRYCMERKQFGQYIINFDAQKGRLAEMVARIFSVDSFGYATAGAIDTAMADLPPGSDSAQAIVGVLRDFALEASIMKVAGSEVLSMVADRGIKMHGGYGFLDEYKIERIFRDNVVDMIFEGTNDINRLVVFDFLVRRAIAGQIGFREGMERLDDALAKEQLDFAHSSNETGTLVKSTNLVTAYLVNQVMINVGKGMRTNQMAAMNVSNAIIEAYLAYATYLRVKKLVEAGDSRSTLLKAVARFTAEQAKGRVVAYANETICSVVPKEKRNRRLEDIWFICGNMPDQSDMFALRRDIADGIIATGRYSL